MIDKRADAIRAIREVADRICDKHREKAALNQAADILERQDESCKFNCRTQRAAFTAGYLYDDGEDLLTADEAFDEWKKSNAI